MNQDKAIFMSQAFQKSSFGGFRGTHCLLKITKYWFLFYHLKVHIIYFSSLTAQHHFAIIAKWHECFSDLNLIAYMFFNILPIITILFALYYLDKTISKIGNDGLEMIKSIEKCVRWTCITFFTQSFITFGENFKNAFFQKHIYFKDALWLPDESSQYSMNGFIMLPIMVLIGILFNAYKKSQTQE
jgi:hypothetical protein